MVYLTGRSRVFIPFYMRRAVGIMAAFCSMGARQHVETLFGIAMRGKNDRWYYGSLLLDGCSAAC
jgi:hypothetical protein